LKADVAQLVEQSIRNRQVIGSSPIVGSIFYVALLHPALARSYRNKIPHLWHAARRVVGLAAYLISLCDNRRQFQHPYFLAGAISSALTQSSGKAEAWAVWSGATT
jgi:hypothetical protein